MSEISEEPQPTPTTMPAVEEAFEEIEVDEPLVGIIMGSKSDMPEMERPARSSPRRASTSRCA